ncbi:phage terminase small subunit [Geomicrobium sp. JCM 19038]|uniref:phage terminase small subunit n=1 Tax=Geomicrobium sp. JCM 19038 TaxID=1460635 RepID=UPI00045F3EFE|nr:phage terminase small subunit [Geomicrobium sp. JCM 19038]GAK09615.1 terminase small subunit, YqaS homolog [Geomicrobium sp. JCM 19038]
MLDKHEQAEKDYVQGMKYKDIADKHGVSLNTVKSWKKRHGWTREKGAPSTKGVHTKKRGAQQGNKNAMGYGAPARNGNARTHGLFAKYLPEETLEIFDSIDDIQPVDIIWANIKLQFASIMRAQQIMFVEGKEDVTKELKKEESTNFGDKIEYEIQFAWDKQASFLNSQSRAMGELRSMLKQFGEMAHEDDHRLLEAEKMKSVIAKTKAETSKLENEGNTSDPPTIHIVDRWGNDD